MRSSTISLLFLYFVSVGAELNGPNTYLQRDDANILKLIPKDWNIINPRIVTGINVTNINVDKIENNAFDKFTNLRKLILSGRINEIKDGAFIGLTNIKHMVLEGNYIHDIGVNVFSNLHQLEWINIKDNKINQIRLKNLEMLNYLFLSDNEITELDNKNFTNLPNLSSIFLNSNKIHNIKNGTFAGCPKLKTLYLNNNQLSNIEPNAFRDLQDLVTLDLSHNYLIEITANHFKQLTSLQQFNLSYNNITFLDEFLLRTLTNLISIWFQHNSIRSLPERLFSNTRKLEVIDFRFNLLKEFHLYDNLVNLRKVNLQHNIIESIKLSATNLRNVEELDLRDNKLTHLDDSFQHLISLRGLSLRNNKFQTFPLCIPSNLTDLDLSQNELHEITLDKLCGSATQGMLQVVNLSSNHFTSFKLMYSIKSLLDSQPQLHYIDLRMNFFNAENLKFIQSFKLRDRLSLKIVPQRNVVTNNKNVTWIAVASAALAVAIFGVIGAILFKCRLRIRRNTNTQNTNNAVVFTKRYADDVRPSRANNVNFTTTAAYDYPTSAPLYDDVAVQPTYLIVLPNRSDLYDWQLQDGTSEETNHYEEIY